MRDWDRDLTWPSGLAADDEDDEDEDEDEDEEEPGSSGPRLAFGGRL